MTFNSLEKRKQFKDEETMTEPQVKPSPLVPISHGSEDNDRFVLAFAEKWRATASMRLDN